MIFPAFNIPIKHNASYYSVGEYRTKCFPVVYTYITREELL